MGVANTAFLLTFFAVHEFASGPSCHFAAPRQFGRFRSEADIQRAADRTEFISTALMLLPAKSVQIRLHGDAQRFGDRPRPAA